MAYNKDTHGMEYYNNTDWVPMGGGGGFGIWVDVTSVATSGTAIAATDGLIIAYSVQGDNREIYGQTPTGITRDHNRDNWYAGRVDITMPVRAKDTWIVIGATKVWWIPIGN